MNALLNIILLSIASKFRRITQSTTLSNIPLYHFLLCFIIIGEIEIERTWHPKRSKSSGKKLD